MKKKMVAAMLCVAMTAGLLAGCGGSSDNKAGADVKGDASKGSVYWLNFKPEADEALQALAKTYTEETGIKVDVVTAASGEYGSTLTTEMEKDKAPTLFVITNQAMVSDWGEYALDLKGTDVYNELTTDSFTLYDENGKACSIGYCYESYGIIVNKKLLAAAGHSLDEIKDFASLKAVADDIHANAATLGFDAFTSAGMESNSSWRFSGHLANMPLYYESRDDKWSEQPATIKGTYLDNFKNIWDLYITDSATDKAALFDATLDAEKEFVDGKAVFFQNGSWEYAAVSAAIADEDLAMIPIYCGVEGEEKAGLCSGTENCWAVNAEADEDDIAATLDFMKWCVTSEAGTKCFAEQFGAIPYKKAAASTNVFLQNANDLLAAGNYNVDWAFNYTPNVDEWRANLVSAMNGYDAGGSWDDVVTAFVNGWDAQYKATH